LFFFSGSHTSELIKKQFDQITNKFQVSEKLFKIVADQAANVKCAFKNTTSSKKIAEHDLEDSDPLNFVEKLTFTMLFKQRKAELISEKESILKKHLLKVINLFLFSLTFLKTSFYS
jgi:hypothetical protein